MYTNGIRLLSISDNFGLELKDENGEPCVMVFKRCTWNQNIYFLSILKNSNIHNFV